ncbi:prephenate dehydratase [Candidatus Bathyarchaeota archaeon]|jgi:chorismate mutase/prephenate dehydratase|nr:prephenate dehydratase [Candidatus Bathyarchaeota archaeon]
MPNKKSKAGKQKVRVAFQGERGAYSESAVYTFFGASVDVKPCRDLAEVFENVDKQETQSGVVPVENSLEGSVNQTYDLFLTHDLKVCGEIILRISHCLIANPNTTLEAVKTVYSHPQALAQCRSFLERLGRELIPTYDTAGSVKMLKEKGLKDAAAVASERAAELYGMKILAREIEDNPANYTRFFVLSKEDSPMTGRDKTSIIFAAAHTPGSLYHALGEFAKRNINLAKIESRPTRQTPWEYNFYLDFEGHRTEENCAAALRALEKGAAFLKILGSYPRAA